MPKLSPELIEICEKGIGRTPGEAFCLGCNGGDVHLMICEKSGGFDLYGPTRALDAMERLETIRREVANLALPYEVKNDTAYGKRHLLFQLFG